MGGRHRICMPSCHTCYSLGGGGGGPIRVQRGWGGAAGWSHKAPPTRFSLGCAVCHTGRPTHLDVVTYLWC